MKAFRPTKEWIERLQIGDLAIDVFGNISKVTDIYARGKDIHKKAYICLCVQHGQPGSWISQSYTEGEIHSTIGLTNKYYRSDSIPKEIITEDFKEIKNTPKICL